MKEFSTTKPVDRRSFLSSAALASGSLVLASKAAAQTAAADVLNVALIGAGTQGQALLNCCAKIEGIHVKAVCDIWESYNLKRASAILEGFKQTHTPYTDYREMLDKEKDLHAVLIATPDFCHAEQTSACLKAGLNVYCESMMSNTLEGARAMIQDAKSSGKLLQIGHQRRSNPRYQYSLAHILNETKMLGKVTALNGQWNRPVQPERGFPKRAALDDATLNKFGYASMQQFRNWEWYKGFGCGPIATFGVHQIDVFNWFMETTPKSVMAIGGTDFYDPKSFQWFDTVMAIFDYNNTKDNIRGFYQTISSNSNFGYFENFMGDQGTLYLSEAGGRVKVYREPAAPDWEKWVKIGILESDVKAAPPKKEVKDEKKPADAVLDVQETVIPPSYNLPVKFTDPVYQPHLANFFNAIRGKEKLNCPAEVAYPATVIVLKINEAVQESKRIDFKPEDFQV